MPDTGVNQLVAIPKKILRDFTTDGINGFPMTVSGIECIAFTWSEVNKFIHKNAFNPRMMQTEETDMQGILIVREIVKPPARKNVTGEAESLAVNDLRARYVQFCRGEHNRRVEELARGIEESRVELESHQASIVDLINKQRDTEIELKVLSTTIEQMKADFMKQLEKIQHFNDVALVDTDGKNLWVETKQLNLEYKGATYAIGRFRIEVCDNGLSGSVRIKNLENPSKSNWQHPAVMPNGMSISGNILEVVPQLIGQRDFPTLISVCIQFLKHFAGEEDGGRLEEALREWPCIRAKGEDRK